MVDVGAMEPVWCAECGDARRDVIEAVMRGRPEQVCFCVEAERLDELDRREREHVLPDPDDDYLERCDRAHAWGR